ncbi:MAG: thioether cross-link-forming SCIFF peptide maturase [Peptococcaceae bacterium]|jgi:uncharacterized protein|nr:thioether cross-link-forming SCIFF peptide maturase [Peptococcaceae bacterium]
MELDFSLIHKYQFDHKYIVLDVDSGLVHDVSPEFYHYLDALEQSAGRLDQAKSRMLADWPDTLPGEPDGLAELVEEMRAQGTLFSDNKGLLDYQPPRDRVVKALCLHAAHDCNLRCRYCFAGTGAFGGHRALMSVETGKAALDFLFGASQKRVHIEVDYFGGEPLMNFDAVRQWILYAREEGAARGKLVKQTLTTNGLLLTDEILSFLNQHDVALVLSLDGRKNVHDHMRPFPSGKGSYDAVLPRLKAAAASRNYGNYYLRGTFTRYNLDFCRDAAHLLEEGFDIISIEPVVTGGGAPYALKIEDIPAIREEYEKLTRFWLEKYNAGEGFNFFHFNVDLNQGPCLPKRLSGCGAGREYMAVAPDGVLYPCHQFVGAEEFQIGNVFQGIQREDIGETFQKNHVLNKPACRGCWARFYCGGGCHANAWHQNGALSQPYEIGCLLERKRLECALFLQVMLYENKSENESDEYFL